MVRQQQPPLSMFPAHLPAPTRCLLRDIAKRAPAVQRWTLNAACKNALTGSPSTAQRQTQAQPMGAWPRYSAPKTCKSTLQRPLSVRPPSVQLLLMQLRVASRSALLASKCTKERRRKQMSVQRTRQCMPRHTVRNLPVQEQMRAPAASRHVPRAGRQMGQRRRKQTHAPKTQPSVPMANAADLHAHQPTRMCVAIRNAMTLRWASKCTKERESSRIHVRQNNLCPARAFAKASVTLQIQVLAAVLRLTTPQQPLTPSLQVWPLLWGCWLFWLHRELSEHKCLGWESPSKH